MAKEIINIIAMKNGVQEGFIQSVSRTKGTFKTTKIKSNAKKYTNIDVVQSEIDDLMGMGFEQGYIFIYQ